MTRSEDRLSATIPDPALLERAESGDPETVSVIVELRTVPPTVELGSDTTGRGRPPRPVEVTGGADPAERDRVADEVARRVEELGGDAVVRLRAANALVCRLDGVQLAQLAEHPDVVRIEPNRRLGRGLR